MTSSIWLTVITNTSKRLLIAMETSADRDGQDAIRCNICGRYFQPSEICDAFDHVSDRHGDHAEGEIDALAEAQQDAQFDYSDLLQEPVEEIDNIEPASN
jgi:uncharacterized C2H2 Zn-finger protein